jgi:hypothetical protein
MEEASAETRKIVRCKQKENAPVEIFSAEMRDSMEAFLAVEDRAVPCYELSLLKIRFEKERRA